MLPIPIVVLYLPPPHQHSLSTKDRLAHAAVLMPTGFGTGNKRHCCVGCRQSLSANPYIIGCLFPDNGFPFSGGSPAYPCHLAYHTVLLLGWSSIHLTTEEWEWANISEGQDLA